jgi:polyisoprenoid-binding protein YceI
VEAESPGMLTLHGVTKPIHFHYAASGAKPTYDVSGAMSIDYTDFLGHKISKFGATVQPAVKVDVHARLSDTDL